MKVTVDPDRCRGHGICVGHSPEVFQLSDDGFTVVLLPEPPPAHRDAVRKAISQCPERAISMSPERTS